jgi:rod shape-determining protein MreC
MVVFRRDPQRLLLTAIVVVAVVLIFLDTGRGGFSGTVRSGAHDAIEPVRSAVDTAFQPARSVAGDITDYRSLQAQNQRLRRTAADLRGQLRRNRGVGAEVGELQKLIDLPSVEDATGVAARVTGGAPGNFDRTVAINKGSSKGIRVGYPVVTGEGLVGTITQVASNQATVTLVDSPNLGVGVRLEVSNAVAITQPRTGDRAIPLAFVSDPGARVQRGELVFTAAAANAAFPPAIPVGTVTSYSKGPQDLAPTITVAPLVNPDNLDFVKVLRWPDPTAAQG